MRYLILLLALAAGISVKAQDPEFTQYYAHPMYLNPAFTGSSPCPRAIAMHRNQWPAIPGGFITSATGYDAYSKTLSGGLGVHVLSDVVGDGTIISNQISAAYSYHLRVDRKWALRAGIEMGFRQKTLRWDNLVFGDQIDSRYGFIFPTNEIQRGGDVKNLTIATGLIAHTDKSWIGFSAHHLNQPNESFIYGTSRLPMKLSFHAGTKLEIERGRYVDSWYFSPNFLYRRQGEFNQANLGFYISGESLTFGVWYRGIVFTDYTDSFILNAGFRTEKLNFGYSYDLTVGQLTPNTGGSHEISIRLNLECRPAKAILREIPCPDF